VYVANGEPEEDGKEAHGCGHGRGEKGVVPVLRSEGSSRGAHVPVDDDVDPGGKVRVDEVGRGVVEEVDHDARALSLAIAGG
jgi:hypothetical protein